MITLTYVYWLAGAAFAAYALLGLRDSRYVNAAFWGLLALSMFAGDRLGDFGNGILVLGLVGIAGFGGLKRAGDDAITREVKQEGAARFGNGLFAIALIIPAAALIGPPRAMSVRISEASVSR